MYREAKARLGDPVLAWADIVGDPERRRRYQQARGKGGLVRVVLGRGRRDVAAAHVHTIKTYGPDRVRRLLADPGDVDGVALRRDPLHPAHRRRDDVVLRLVRRPAGGQPAGVRRPDRRAGVRGLVGRDVPDDVGLQRPGHPHPGRALDGRGPLPRHQGRHGQPRLRRQHQVRRRVAACAGRHRRGAGDGDGPRDPARSSSSTASVPFFHRLRAHLHRPAVPGAPRPSATARCVPGKFLTAADLGRRRRRSRVEDRAARRGDRASRSCPTASMGFRYADSGVGKWNLDLDGVTPALSCAEVRTATASRSRCCSPASTPPTGTAPCCAAACRSAASAATWSPPCST